MRTWAIFTTNGTSAATHATTARTAELALQDFKCPTGAKVIGILLDGTVRHISPIYAPHGIAFVPLTIFRKGARRR